MLLLGVSAVSAQTVKTDEPPAKAPVAQQNAPVEKTPALNSKQSKTRETTGQAAPTTSASDKKEMKTQKMNKDDPDD